jgi:hypothetical protein
MDYLLRTIEFSHGVNDDSVLIDWIQTSNFALRKKMKTNLILFRAQKRSRVIKKILRSIFEGWWNYTAWKMIKDGVIEWKGFQTTKKHVISNWMLLGKNYHRLRWKWWSDKTHRLWPIFRKVWIVWIQKLWDSQNKVNE